MSNRIDILFPRDLEAYVDGELAGDRLAAVYQKLQRDDRAFTKTLELSRHRDSLRAAKPALYCDPVLRNEVAALLSKVHRKDRAA